MTDEDKFWALELIGRSGNTLKWFGYWETWEEAETYLYRETDGGEMDAHNPEWFEVSPLDGEQGEEMILSAKNRPWE